MLCAYFFVNQRKFSKFPKVKKICESMTSAFRLKFSVMLPFTIVFTFFNCLENVAFESITDLDVRTALIYYALYIPYPLNHVMCILFCKSTQIFKISQGKKDLHFATLSAPRIGLV